MAEAALAAAAERRMLSTTLVVVAWVAVWEDREWEVGWAGEGWAAGGCTVEGGEGGVDERPALKRRKEPGKFRVVVG